MVTLYLTNIHNKMYDTCIIVFLLTIPRVQRRMVLEVNFFVCLKLFALVVAIFSPVHDVETIFHLH